MKYIVVPVCNVNDRCKGYLETLLDSAVAGGYFEQDYTFILCYDNCSNEFEQHFLDKYMGLRVAAISNRNPKNLNFTKNVNTGMRFALSREDVEYIIVLNQDTALPPACNFNQLPGEGLTFATPVDDMEAIQELSKAGFKREPVPRGSGFCMCFSKALIDKIGILDERFLAGFDDDDVSVRTALAGFPVEISSVKVHHELKNRDENTVSSTGAYDLHQLGLMLEIFRDKWSIPRIQHEQFNEWILANHQWHEAMKCQ